MRSFILSLPNKIQPIFVIFSVIFSAFIIATLCSFLFDKQQLLGSVDIISSVYQVMGTIYAILLTFTLWNIWQNFSEAGISVENEAYSLLDLVHMLETATGKKNNELRTAALDYSIQVVEKEWPTLKNFTNAVINLRERNHVATMKVLEVIEKITPTNTRGTTVFDHALSLLTRWLDARRTRILIARGDSAKALWPLLFTGAFVVFAFHGLFIANTLGIWIALLFGTSLVIGVTFYLIFTLDCPFSGSLSIDSEPFTLAINLLKNPSEETNFENKDYMNIRDF